MTVGAADLHKAIATAWDASSLNTTFKALWPSSVTASEYPVLHDQEAQPGQPFPYVVMEATSTDVVERMYREDGQYQTRDVAVTFHIYANDISGDSRTSKEIAAAMVEEVMKLFGGHPTETPSATLILDNGTHLINRYLNDYGLREEDATYRWTIQYEMRLDVPVAD